MKPLSNDEVQRIVNVIDELDGIMQSAHLDGVRTDRRDDLLSMAAKLRALARYLETGKR